MIMTYVSTTWKDGDTITADLLNHIEQGVQNIATDIVKSKHVSINLSVSNWTGDGPYTQTVSVSGVTAVNIIIASPDPASWEAAGKAMAYCSAQANNSLTFTCEKKPTINLTYSILIQGVE